MGSAVGNGKDNNAAAFREFRAAPWTKMWLACLMAAGWLVVVVASVALLLFIRSLGDDGFRLRDGVVFLGVLSISFFLPFTLNLLLRVYRVRVEKEGVHYRGLLGWTFWPWEEFESVEAKDWGLLWVVLASREKSDRRKIERYEPFYLVNPRRRAFRRTLPIGVFENREALLAACCEHWSPPPTAEPETIPPPVVVPETMEIDLLSRLPWRIKDMALWFSAEGIRLTERGKETLYVWREVSAITMEYATHDDLDFTEARLILPERTVTFGKRKGARFWGPSVRVIDAFLRQHVDEERIHVEFGDSPRKKLESVEQQLIRASSIISRETLFAFAYLGFMCGFVPWLSAAVILRLGASRGVAASLAVGVPVGILACVLAQRDRRRKVAELETERKELLALLELEKTREDGD